MSSRRFSLFVLFVTAWACTAPSEVDELLDNGDFSMGTAYWTVGGSGAANLDVVDGVARINVADGGADLNSLNFYHLSAPAGDPGTRYRVSFVAWASHTRPLRVFFFNSYSPPIYTCIDETVEVSTEIRPFAFEFILPASHYPQTLIVPTFYVGGEVATIYLDDISVVRH